jgi:hypothetical protein
MCNEELTLDNFSKKIDNKDGLYSNCKKCQNKIKSDNYYKKHPKSNYKNKNGNTIIDINIIYNLIFDKHFKFVEWVDNYEGQHSRFIIECKKGYQTQTTYHNLRLTNECTSDCVCNQFISSISYVKQFYIENNCEPLFDTYNGAKELLPFKCLNHPDEIQYQSFHLFKLGYQCKYCTKIRIPFLNGERGFQKGENHWNWNGGCESINLYLRNNISSWKKESIINCLGKCIITGEKFDDIHHLFNYNMIVKELKFHLPFELKDKFLDHSDEELEIIKDLCLKIHYQYGLGVCLHRKIHELFHVLYERQNNNPLEFEDFKIRLKLGEFNNFLEANNLKLII